MTEQADMGPSKGEQRAEELGFADDARQLAEEEEQGMTGDAPAEPQGQ